MCGVVMKRRKGETAKSYHVVVAGGLNQDGYLDVVEIYDVLASQWIEGE